MNLNDVIGDSRAIGRDGIPSDFHVAVNDFSAANWLIGNSCVVYSARLRLNK